MITKLKIKQRFSNKKNLIDDEWIFECVCATQIDVSFL